MLVPNIAEFYKNKMLKSKDIYNKCKKRGAVYMTKLTQKKSKDKK